MDVRILGPLEVEDRNAPVALGGQKQRALLALLALGRGSVVSSDRLIEELWGDEAPATARNVVQGHVSQLRKAFGGNGRLETRGRGYVLHLERGELDLDRFERLYTEGRERLAVGDAAGASVLLHDALALWRGPALADLAFEPFASAEAERLEERRLACLEEQIEADLALGQAADLVPELERLVGEHPLRERFRGQLMLALYRSGRQAEALEAYQAARRTLVEELGIEPGPALQELERQILNQDPSLAPPPRLQPEAEREAGRTRRRRGWLMVAGGLVILAVAAGAAVWQLTDSGSEAREIGVVAGSSVAGIDPESNRVVAQIPVGRSPTAVAVGEGAVWVLNADDQTLTRIDPDTKQATTFATGTTPTELAAGEGSVWVGNGSRQRAAADAIPAWGTWSVSRIDPTTSIVGEAVELPAVGDVPVHTWRAPGQNLVAVGGGSAWIVNPDRTVSRISAETGRVTAVIDVKTSAITFGDGAVWLVSDDRVVRVSPRTNRITASIPFGSSGLGDIAVGGGAVWVTEPGAESLWRIDPGPTSRKRAITIGPGVGDIAYGEGAVWVASAIEGVVTRVDPLSNAVAARLTIGNTPRGLAAGYGTVWVAVGGASGTAVPAVTQAASSSVETEPSSFCGPLFYGGPLPGPDVLLVSELPLRGGHATYGGPMPDAIRLVLRRHGFRAGPYSVGYQSCDYSTAQGGGTDLDKCIANMDVHVRNPDVVGVIGTVASDCAYVQIPIANRAPEGPLAMISPSNSYLGLTRAGPFVPAGQLDELYPTGRRNYVRLYPADNAQAAALAVLAGQLELSSVYVLHDGPEYGQAIATMFRDAADALGVKLAGFQRWDPEADGYDGVVRAIERSRADGVLFAGLFMLEASRLMRELDERMPSDIAFMAPDSFVAADVLTAAGPAAIGAYLAYPGLPDSALDDAGKEFVDELAATQPNGVMPYYTGTYAAQAVEVLLDAIARSDGSRASVTEQLFRTRIEHGLLGEVAFDANGDITRPATTIFRIVGKNASSPTFLEEWNGSVVDRVIIPPPALLR